MSREFTIAPVGLVTQPNKIGVYPQGAMERADALCMRAPGKLTPFRVPTGFIARFVAANVNMASEVVYPLGTSKLFLSFADSTSLVLTTNQELGDSITQARTILTAVESQQMTRARAASSVRVFRDRFFLMYSTGLAVLDALDGTITTTRWAQMPQPTIFIIGQIGGQPAQNINTVVSYAVVFKRVFADGYEIIGAPSPIQRFRAQTAIANQMFVSWADPTNIARSGVVAGDILELYRSLEASCPSDGLNTDSGTTLYLVQSHTVTAGEAAADNIMLIDIAAPNQIVGRELYSNPGQETLQSSRFIPPLAKCFADYKGFAFYGNCQEPGVWIAAFPGGLGLLSTAATRLNGVGVRLFTGTYTTGSGVITAISAADIVGLQVGQFLLNSNFPGFSANSPTNRITVVGATSITVSGVATGPGGTIQMETWDAVEINGTVLPIPDLLGFLSSKAIQGPGAFTYVLDQTVAYREINPSIVDATLTFGQRMQVTPQRPIQNTNSLTVRATSPNNFDPPVPNLSTLATAKTFSPTQRKNLTRWSWEQQPESVAPSTYAFIGSGEHYQYATTRDVMWIFASDGLWRFTGYGTRPSGIQANFRVDLIDRTLILAGPGAFAVLRDAVFAYTNIGLVKISDAGGVQPISRGIIGDLIPGRYWVEDDDISMAADEVLDEVWLNIVTGNYETNTAQSNCYVWSDTYQVFTKLGQSVGPGQTLQQLAFDRFQGLMVMGIGDGGTTNSPRTSRHDPTVASFSAWTADFQPQYGTDPVSTKQWGSMCVICDAASAAKNITPRVNTIAYGSNPLVLYPNTKDSRAFFGIDIEAPAQAAVLQPGLSGAAETTVTELRGVAMQYDLITEQQLVR